MKFTCKFTCMSLCSPSHPTLLLSFSPHFHELETSTSTCNTTTLWFQERLWHLNKIHPWHAILVRNHFSQTAPWESEARKNLLFATLAQWDVCSPCPWTQVFKTYEMIFFSLALNGMCTFACCQVWSKINLNTQKDGTISLGPCVRRGRLMSCYGDPFLEWNWIMVKRIRLGVRLKFNSHSAFLVYAWLTLCKLIDLSWYTFSWMKEPNNTTLERYYFTIIQPLGVDISTL